MRVILAAGATETGLIEGISAAGATPAVMTATAPADAEILVYGQPTTTSSTPVSPTGCPTPAAVSRAVREVVGFDVTVLDAGMAEPTRAPTVDLGAATGTDCRQATAVPNPEQVFEPARRFGSSLPDERLLIGETILGGTTTALGVISALGEPTSVSSSFPDNPVARKREVVAEGVSASGLSLGDCAGTPLTAIEAMGDPVQAAVLGTATGALGSGTEVVLAGGTQMIAVAALLRHGGLELPLELATTRFVAEDPAVDLAEVSARYELGVTVTDPGFEHGEHVAVARYLAGEAKEGVAMGGTLSLVPEGEMAAVRRRLVGVCARLGIEGDTPTAREDESAATKSEDWATDGGTYGS